MNWLWIIIMIVFLLFLIHGWKKGLLRMLFSLIAVIVLMCIISYITPYVNEFIKEHTGVYRLLEERCTEKIQSHIEDSLDSQRDFSEAEVLLPGKIVSYLTEGGEEILINSGFYYVMGTKAANLILSGLSFFIALILSVIAVRLLDKGLGIVNHIPVLKGINRTLGIVAGCVEAYLLISLFFLFAALAAGTKVGEVIISQINHSNMLSFLYYNNVLQNLLLHS